MHSILRNTTAIEIGAENYCHYYSWNSNRSIRELYRENRNGTYNWAKEPLCQIVS